MSNFVDNLFIKGMRLRMKETSTSIASVLHVADTIVKAVFSVFIYKNQTVPTTMPVIVKITTLRILMYISLKGRENAAIVKYNPVTGTPIAKPTIELLLPIKI